MIHDPGPAPTGWPAPPWATARQIEDDAIEHRRRLGEIATLDDDPLAVTLVQRDDLDPSVEPVTVTRAAAQVSVAGVRLDGAHARRLARLLTSAAELIDADAWRSTPEPGYPTGTANGAAASQTRSKLAR